MSEKYKDTLEFQSLVKDFTLTCFGTAHTFDKTARADRFVEEVYELLQSVGYDRTRLSQLENYVWSRSPGTPIQEVGGVSITFNAFCTAYNLNLIDGALDELVRCWDNIETIRAKQLAKENDSALPGVTKSP